MEIQDTMINDAIKQLAGYKHYKHKKDESKNGKAAKNQKNNMCLLSEVEEVKVADNISKELIAVELAKSINIEEQRLQQREIMTQMTIERQVEKDIEDTYAAEDGLKLKGVVTEDLAIQSLLDLRKEYKENRLELTDSDTTRVSSCSATDEEKYNENNDFDDSNMYISTHEDKRDGDDAIANPERNLEVLRYLSGASKVPLGTNVDVEATDFVLQEMFPNDADHHILSPPANTIHDLVTNSQHK
nr:hypothetical protein [Tanacetum cinerariifolium]